MQQGWTLAQSLISKGSVPSELEGFCMLMFPSCNDVPCLSCSSILLLYVATVSESMVGISGNSPQTLCFVYMIVI